jgi:hypothetical protein
MKKLRSRTRAPGYRNFAPNSTKAPSTYEEAPIVEFFVRLAILLFILALI